MNRLELNFTLEIGLILGFLLFIAGTLISAYAFFKWSEVNFGRLDYGRILRIVIPAATLILLGVQIIFSSFFLSILKIKRAKIEVDR